MNCKPGDLAVIVSAPKEIQNQIGKIVETVKLLPNWEGIPCWQIKNPFRDRFGICEGIADKDLRPIRDNDGEDQTLTWAGKPNNIKETA